MTDGTENEPAFPITSVANHQFCGLSIRDHFAGLAMQSLIPCAHGMTFGTANEASNLTLAYAAYAVADAMLKARGTQQ